ncbi:DUF5068 domain-containing protein [Metabacillus litoralis]|uniref:DUF5068 domain-containing protein n=1 Tax=Metabacillus litoralis TaxID=152268 RepID=UPI00203E9FC4|nr:DUF5068 domain-containing protein [Metabacillus litoralis]MCM3162506.1 DUF5068 domain-containing protein [Metabacillus litoralis]
MKKSKFLFSTLFFSTLLLAACGNDEEASGTKQEEAPAQAEETQTANDEVETETEEQDAGEQPQGDNETLNPFIAEDSEGNVEILYTNKDPQYTHDMEGFKVSVDEYQLVKVTDVNEYSTIYFDDQVDGYVVTAKVTIENGTDKPMYYNNSHRIQLSNDLDYIPSDWKAFVPEDQQIFKIKKNQDDISLFEAGEKVTGLLTFKMTNEDFEKLKSVKPKYVIEGGVAENSDFSGSISGNSPSYDFIYNDEQAETTASQPQFFQDRLTSDNWADKKMIFEKANINDTKKIGDVNVTVEGVQYTEVIPTEANKEMFSDFGDSGVAALTVKVKIDNGSTTPVSINNLGTILNVDDNRVRVLSQGMAEPRDPATIAAGETGEKLHVFLFRKDEFGLYKKFVMEFGPFYAENGEQAFKGRTAEFTLPR